MLSSPSSALFFVLFCALATRSLDAALFVLVFGVLWSVLGALVQRWRAPSEQTLALQAKYETMPGDRRLRRRTAARRRAPQSEDLKGDAFFVAGALMCVAGFLGLLVACVQ